MNKLKNCRGSLFVDVSIILPIFFCFSIFLISIFNIGITKQKVYEVLTDEARLDSVNSVIKSNLGISSEVRNRIIGSDNYRGSELKITKTPSLDFRLNNLKTSYKIKLKFLGQNVYDLNHNEGVKYRIFNGKTTHGSRLAFDELTKNDMSDIVYVFPRNGERYHKEDCFYIKNKPREKLYNFFISNNYKECKICNPSSLSFGTLVYVYEKTNKIFHLGTCSFVSKYVIKTTIKDAKEEGYTPCKVCLKG